MPLTFIQDEFWGVEVKPGKKVTVKLLDSEDSVLHLTQARAFPHSPAHVGRSTCFACS